MRPPSDVAQALFKAVGKQPVIEYIPMPLSLREKYQYFTRADVSKLRAAGCVHQCRLLEDAIADYVGTYLRTDSRLTNSKEVRGA